MPSVRVSAALVRNCGRDPDRGTWLDRLPALIESLRMQWSLEIGEVFDGDEVSCAWVARVTRSGGTRAVLKVAMPHLEGAHEIDSLRFWKGDPTVHLLDADEASLAMPSRRVNRGRCCVRSRSRHKT